MISQRIKQLRKTLQMTQTEFSRGLGLTQGHLTSIENGKRNLTGRTVMSICRTYNVNEQWLKTGEGSMFSEQESDGLLLLIKEYRLDEDESRFVESFLKLPSKQRRNFARTVMQLSVGSDEKVPENSQ